MNVAYDEAAKAFAALAEIIRVYDRNKSEFITEELDQAINAARVIMAPQFRKPQSR